jgi:hypothetical protein
MEQIQTIELTLENLAWHGTRLQIKDERILNEFGLFIELSWHVGMQQYMNTIYYYDINHKCFPYSQSIINYVNVFAKTIKDCL